LKKIKKSWSVFKFFAYVLYAGSAMTQGNAWAFFEQDVLSLKCPQSCSKLVIWQVRRQVFLKKTQKSGTDFQNFGNIPDGDKHDQSSYHSKKLKKISEKR